MLSKSWTLVQIKQQKKKKEVVRKHHSERGMLAAPSNQLIQSSPWVKKPNKKQSCEETSFRKGYVSSTFWSTDSLYVKLSLSIDNHYGGVLLQKRRLISFIRHSHITSNAKPILCDCCFIVLDAGMGLCQYVDLCFHASSLPCLQTFWHAIPTSFCIF